MPNPTNPQEDEVVVRLSEQLHDLASTFEAAAEEELGRHPAESRGLEKAAAECRMRLAALEQKP